MSEIDKINIEHYYVGAVRDALYNTMEKRKEVEEKFSYWKTDLKNIGNNYKNSGFLLINLKNGVRPILTTKSLSYPKEIIISKTKMF